MKPAFLSLFALVGLGLLVTAAHAQWTREVRPTPPPRAYLCIDGRSAGEITKKASDVGARGWKMVAASQAGSKSIWCFEQYLSARPQTD